MTPNGVPINRCPSCEAEPVYRTVKHQWTTTITHTPGCPHDGRHHFTLDDFRDQPDRP